MRFSWSQRWRAWSTTSSAVIYAIELKKQDAPIVFSSNIAANTFSKPIRLDPNLFQACVGAIAAQYLPGNDALFVAKLAP